MTTTITGASAHIPISLEGYVSRRDAQHVIYQPPLDTYPSVSLRAATRRRGRLTAAVATLAEAESLSADLGGARSLTLADTDLPGIGMRFVLEGDVTVLLDEETRNGWHVSFGYIEVQP